MAASDKISYQWLPIYDKYRYRPLPVSVDFLQNAFDIVFLLFFIWYWNWGPLLVVLYYVIETLVTCLFTAIKWWRSKAVLSDDRMVSIPTFKFIAILTLCAVIGVFSYGQILAVHDALGLVMSVPSWEILVSDKSQFMLGVLAIVLLQTTEYYKHILQSKHIRVELVTAILTPVLTVSFIDLKWASVMIALLLGFAKLIAGQLQLTVKN
ncbi:MAG: hypothetical protein K0R51_983 [Cytophagaceae bacterium]|nr:hypothetical protein [Cytophagaceae bacterium]